MSAELTVNTGGDGTYGPPRRTPVTPEQFAAIIAYTLERTEVGRFQHFDFCGVASQDGWVCSRQRGHEGLHVAARGDGRFCANGKNNVEVW